MLILSRKLAEEIYIDTPQGRIIVKVTEFYVRKREPYGKLGLEAPKEFKITRDDHPSIKQQDAK